MGNFFESGKIRQRKERDGLRLSFAVPMIQLDSNPTAPTHIRLWETFTLTFRWALFGVFFLLLMVCLIPSISLWEEPGRVAQSVGHLTRKSGVLGSIPGLATYFRFSFRFFKKGSCQLLAKVCARSTG